MPSRSEQIAGLFEAPESFDPADIDALGDDTAAGSRRVRKSSVPDATLETGAGDGRLRMRPEVPVIAKYKGKAVKRKEVFDDDNENMGTDDVKDLGFDDPFFTQDDREFGADDAPRITNVPGGLSISGGLEKEYDQMMKKTQQELKVMRTPSAAEVQSKDREAAHLKKELEAWNALLEFRIHLEGSLAIGHRLPSGESKVDLHAADVAASTEADALAGDLRTLTGTLLALQQTLAVKRGLPQAASPAAGREDGDSWGLVEARMQPMLDWSLTLADVVKEKNRLDVRRSFKVLDQSLALQMQATAEADSATLRKRCTPPPGRHKVIGSSTTDASEGGVADEAIGAERDIYDDHEFYVQLLKEVLGTSSKDESVAEQAKQMQNELHGRRANKKRNRTDVERRASKGRKVRYIPIEKLQNFMAPGPRDGEQSAGSAAPIELSSVEALLQALFAKTGGSL